MPELPHKGILDRDEAAGHAKEHFSAQLKLLQELANYGSNLVVRAYHFSDKGIADAVVCGVLLKQIVSMLDAIEILVRSGAVHAANLPARAAFEASLYLEWILVSDSEKKATYYYVSNLRHERLWASRAIQGTPESSDFTDSIKDLNFDIHKNRPSLTKEGQQNIAAINRILSQPELIKVDKDFEKQRGKRKHDPEWYSLMGVKSIRKIAETLHRIPEYDLFYSKGSQVTHSASYKDHIKFVRQGFHFKPVRHLEGISALLNFTISLVLRTYRMTLQYYHSGEISAFQRQYNEEWREPFLTIKSVKY